MTWVEERCVYLVLLFFNDFFVLLPLYSFRPPTTAYFLFRHHIYPPALIREYLFRLPLACWTIFFVIQRRSPFFRVLYTVVLGFGFFLGSTTPAVPGAAVVQVFLRLHH